MPAIAFESRVVIRRRREDRAADSLRQMINGCRQLDAAVRPVLGQRTALARVCQKDALARGNVCEPGLKLVLAQPLLRQTVLRRVAKIKGNVIIAAVFGLAMPGKEKDEDVVGLDLRAQFAKDLVEICLVTPSLMIVRTSTCEYSELPPFRNALAIDKASGTANFSRRRLSQ